MHRHAAQVAVALVINHRVVRQVALMYVSGVWLLISTDLTADRHQFSHVTIDDCELYEVVARLDEQVAEWRAEGHHVWFRHRHVDVVPR